MNRRRSPWLIVLSSLAVLAAACSSDGDSSPDTGPTPDTGTTTPDTGTTTPDTGTTTPDTGTTTPDTGTTPAGHQLSLEIWEMNEVGGAKAMFDLNKKTGETEAGWTFDTIAGVTDGAIINAEYDAGWTAYAHRGPFIFQVVALTAGDQAALRTDVEAFVKHLAGALPAASEGKKVEQYVPADDAVAGWVEDDMVGKAGVEAGYNDKEIEDIINGHHAPYATEGTAGFAKQDYKK